MAAWTIHGSRSPKHSAWPCPTKEHPGTPILHKEKFTHPDGLGIFTPIEWKPPAEVPDKDYPLILTTGRCIWQWHTGSMTRRSESLEREEPTGWVEINPEDAKALGIKDKEMVKAITRRGQISRSAHGSPRTSRKASSSCRSTTRNVLQTCSPTTHLTLLRQSRSSRPVLSG